MNKVCTVRTKWIGLDWIGFWYTKSDWTGSGSPANGLGLDWILSHESVSYSGRQILCPLYGLGKVLFVALVFTGTSIHAASCGVILFLTYGGSMSFDAAARQVSQDNVCTTSAPRSLIPGSDEWRLDDSAWVALRWGLRVQFWWTCPYGCTTAVITSSLPAAQLNVCRLLARARYAAVCVRCICRPA